MKPIDFFEEKNLEHIFQMSRHNIKLTEEGIPDLTIKPYEKYFTKDCVVAFIKNVEVFEERDGPILDIYSKQTSPIFGDVFIMKVDKNPEVYEESFYSFIVFKKNVLYKKFGCKKQFNKGVWAWLNPQSTIRILEENKNSKILNEEEYLKAKKLAILEALE